MIQNGNWSHDYMLNSLTTCWCLYRHLCDLPGCFLEIDEFAIHTKLYAIHTYYCLKTFALHKFWFFHQYFIDLWGIYFFIWQKEIKE